MPEHAIITSHLKDFREKKDLLALVRAVAMIVRQRRTIEVIYGVYCNLACRPSPLSACSDPELLDTILDNRSQFVRPATLTRDHIIELYGSDFDVSCLPADFKFATYQGVWREGDHLIIGEYGEDSRIAYVTPRSCTINTHYRNVTGVRHIHSIVRYGEEGGFLVATGDGAKVLDLWVKQNGELRFVKRLRKHLAGFTAGARVSGQYYFGSDFSGRPNYIETLDGVKYFFPAKAYRMFVTAFFVFFDRYIVSVNNDLRILGGKRTLTVFDTLEKRFVFCDYLDLQRP